MFILSLDKGKEKRKGSSAKQSASRDHCCLKTIVNRKATKGKSTLSKVGEHCGAAFQESCQQREI